VVASTVPCGACATDNPAANRFCGSCGAEVTTVCPGCSTPQPPGQNFCGSCGHDLRHRGSPSPDTARPSTDAGSVGEEAERRWVTVLFVDLVGFTTLAEDRDPDEVREVQTAYFDLARRIVGRYGGEVEKFIGDAVMAVWGTAVTREDDAELAVRAALDLVDAVTTLTVGSLADGLEARAGVVTGEAAVRVGATGQGMVTGDVVNLAARLQGEASDGAVLTDAATAELAGSAIEFGELGTRQVKGRAEPVTVHRAVQVVAGHRGVYRPDGLLAPFVGRDRELRVVKELFHEVAERSRARLVVVTGEPGVGKSRLGWEFFTYLDGITQVAHWHLGRCATHGEGVAYQALAEVVRHRLRCTEDDPDERVSVQLDAVLDDLVADPDERAWVRERLAVLLGLPSADGVELPRDSLFAGWRHFFERLAGRAPVVVVIEDLHAADEGLLEFLDHLLSWAEDHPILVLGLARPALLERRAIWAHHHQRVSNVALDRLPVPVVRELVDALVEGLPDDLADRVAVRSEGNPLFAVETVRVLVDRGVVRPEGGRYRVAGDAPNLEAIELPPTLQALVAARLDELPEVERRLLRDAAVLGDAFDPDVLQRLAETVGTCTPKEVPGLLAALQRREVLTIRVDDLSPEAGRYRFVQPSIREVAYGRLARRDRRLRHLTVAELLAGGPDPVGDAAAIAGHYLAAVDAVPDAPDAKSLRDDAVGHLERAAARAFELAASDAAHELYERALELTTAGPDRARLLAASGRTAVASGRTEVALERFTDARVALDELGDRDGTVRVLCDEAPALLELDRAGVALERMSAAHEKHSESLPLELRCMLETQLTIASVWVSDYAAADRWAVRASVAAHRCGRWSDLARVLQLRGVAAESDGRPIEGRVVTLAAVELADRLRTANAGLLAGNATWMLLSIDPHRAETLGRTAVSNADRQGDRSTITFARSGLAAAQLHTGAWSAIDTDTLLRLARTSEARARHEAQGPLIALALWRGDDIDPDDLASDDRVYTSSVSRPAQLMVELFAAALADRHDDVLRLGDEGVALALDWVNADLATFFWPVALDVALATGQLDRGWALVEPVISHLSQHLPELAPDLVLAQAAWSEGRLRAAAGETELAEQRYRDAAARFAKLRTPFWSGRLALDRARLAIAAGDRARADAELATAHGSFSSLEAHPFLSQVAAVRAALPPEGATEPPARLAGQIDAEVLQ
jgi:class 3 adenylate cyclase